MIRIVVPLGGEGKRFIEKGYSFPKPLVEIRGKPMIEIVVNNLKLEEPHEFIFVCRRDHIQQYALADVLRLIAPDCQVIEMHQPTAGALCSVLLALEYLENDDELLIANADQFVDDEIDNFITHARMGEWEGYIMTFPSTHPKWSYVKNEGDAVIATVEKRPISHHATVGLYYFRRSSDFLQAAERMLVKNATVMGEFYVCPVYNEMILMGKRVSYYPISKDKMFSLGTPEDVENFAASKAALLDAKGMK